MVGTWGVRVRGPRLEVPLLVTLMVTLINVLVGILVVAPIKT